MAEAAANTIINIDDKSYDLNTLSDKAKAQINNVRVIDQKIAEAQQNIAILQTARNTYLATLKQELPEVAAA